MRRTWEIHERLLKRTKYKHSRDRFKSINERARQRRQENCANGKNYKRKKYRRLYAKLIWRKRRRSRKKYKELCVVLSPSSSYVVVDLPVLLCCCSLTTWGLLPSSIARGVKTKIASGHLSPSFSLIHFFSFTHSRYTMISNKLCKQYICMITFHHF